MITREDCQLIVSENRSFYCRHESVNGQEVEIFNYRFASPQDFIEPVPGTDLKGHELRGLTFVKESRSWVRWLHLHKFHNYTEAPGYFEADLRPKHIHSVMDKVDGSMLVFVRVGDEWLAKTKGTFFSTQAEWGNEFLKQNPDFISLLEFFRTAGMMPIFEYTSPNNRIVLNYQDDRLTLLQVRCARTGLYYDTLMFWHICERHGVKLADRMELTFDELLERQHTQEDTEGYVANFEGQLVKFKTAWYCIKHRQMTNAPTSLKRLVGMTLNEEIDDFIGALADLPTKQAELMAIAEAVRAVYFYIAKRVERVADKAKDYPNQQAFWEAHRDDEFIGVVTKALMGKDIHRYIPMTFFLQWDYVSKLIREEILWQAL